MCCKRIVAYAGGNSNGGKELSAISRQLVMPYVCAQDGLDALFFPTGEGWGGGLPPFSEVLPTKRLEGSVRRHSPNRRIKAREIL